MTSLTVYDLMGEDHTIWCKMADDKRVRITIEDEVNITVYDEESHIYAWESLVSFAKQVLACDERLRQEIEINE